MHSLLPIAKTIFLNHSYWKVILRSGKEVSELSSKTEYSTHPRTGKTIARKRKIEWLEDIVGSGDSEHIKELILCTPQGDAHMSIVESYTAFQFHRSFMAFFGNERTTLAQIIGRVDNRETGECTACIWDCLEQRLYVDHHTDVHAFSAWRPEVAAVGQINLEVTGVRL